MKKVIKNIVVYTDGSCQNRTKRKRKNEGIGGYGIHCRILFKDNSDHVIDYSAGCLDTSSNRMEIMAVLIALKKCYKFKKPVQIYSDSQYVIKSIMNGWIDNWYLDNFRERSNADLWKKVRKVLELYRTNKIYFNLTHVKGHSGIEGNEKADQLANRGRQLLIAQNEKN